MKRAEAFIINYYSELSKHSSESEEIRVKEKDRQEIFNRAYKGNHSDRNYTKAHIKKILTDKTFREVLTDNPFVINERNIDEQLELKQIPEDQFRVSLHFYTKEYKGEAFFKFISANKLTKGDVITAEMIHQAYKEDSKKWTLLFDDKLEILTQKIYERYKGIPVIDQLLYQSLEDVQVGVSGAVEKAHDSIWIIIKGRLIRLAFLSLGNIETLENVCKKIAGDEKIDSLNPYAFSYGEDGSRRVAFKKGFSESWCAIVRKFDTVQNLKNKELLALSGVHDTELLIQAEMLLMKGCVSTIIIGDQGSGKTVKTVRLVEYMYDDLSIRTINNNFETFIRNLFPNKNIIEYKKTDSITEEEAYEISLKSSGKITIFTEIRENKMIENFLNTGRRGSKMALTSMHHNDAHRVVYELAKGLMKEGLHQRISDAVEDVLEVLKIVIEVNVCEDGKRTYGIYELIDNTPSFESDIYNLIDEMGELDVNKTIAKALVKLSQPANYKAVPIVIYDDKTNAYLKKNCFSTPLISHLKKNLKRKDDQLLDDFKALMIQEAK